MKQNYGIKGFTTNKKEMVLNLASSGMSQYKISSNTKIIQSCGQKIWKE